MFRADIATGGKEAVIRLSGQLDANSAPELEDCLRAVLPDVDGIELDLSDLAYVSSAGLRELVRAHKVLSGRGALRISNASPEVMKVLDMTGLSRILDVSGAAAPQPYRYVRIQGRELAENTMWGKGVFSMCMQLIADSRLDPEDQQLHAEIDAWFAEELPWPPPCKRQERVVCWFKTENADEMLRWVRPLLWLLEKYEHPYYLVYTNTPGEIVYEDQYQVCVRVPGTLQIDKLQESWSPED